MGRLPHNSCSLVRHGRANEELYNGDRYAGGPMQLDKTNYTRRLGLPSHLVSNCNVKRYSPIGMTIPVCVLTPATEN